MLYVFGFVQTAVVLSDLYFVDPDPEIEGQESPEHGVRLEVRKPSAPARCRAPSTRRSPSRSGISSGAPTYSNRWTARRAASTAPTITPGVSRGLEPGKRVFDRTLSAAPIEWVGNQLADLEGVLERAGAGGGIWLAPRTHRACVTACPRCSRRWAGSSAASRPASSAGLPAGRPPGQRQSRLAVASRLAVPDGQVSLARWAELM